ncbi:hypothetical protein AAH991_06890 [Microbispora sp. ZYX-F-249]|uniref:DUF3592 domain-containing protein n=2 Tax=Microbispora TaxID=2005 RepID=A0A544YV93_9ACTN|nr:hypothetical protein [Microbispora hainanensis]TQS20678.1 hypothetical protein FLX08_14410 [Microbispora hainanensis]
MYLLVVDGSNPDAASRERIPSGCAIVFVLFGLVFVLAGVRWIGPALQAAKGEGIRGTLTIETRNCRKGCDWSGEFVSSDGRLRVADVHTDDLNHKTQVGDRVAVLYVGDKAYAPEGSTEWLGWVVAMLVGVTIMGWTIWVWRFSGRS